LSELEKLLSYRHYHSKRSLLFHPPADIVGDIFTILLINTIAQMPLWALSFITPSALRAAGDSKFYFHCFHAVDVAVPRSAPLHFGHCASYGDYGRLAGDELRMGSERRYFSPAFHRGEKWYQHRLI
jgi:hypothetical protein